MKSLHIIFYYHIIYCHFYRKNIKLYRQSRLFFCKVDCFWQSQNLNPVPIHLTYRCSPVVYQTLIPGLNVHFTGVNTSKKLSLSQQRSDLPFFLSFPPSSFFSFFLHGSSCYLPLCPCKIIKKFLSLRHTPCKDTHTRTHTCRDTHTHKMILKPTRRRVAVLCTFKIKTGLDGGFTHLEEGWCVFFSKIDMLNKKNVWQ